MNRFLKPELVNCKLNQHLKTINREIKRSIELSNVEAKPLCIENERKSKSNQQKLKKISKSTNRFNKSEPFQAKINPKYYLPRIELKDKLDDKLIDRSDNQQKFESNLRPFIYACVNTNVENDAFKSLEYYEKRNSSISQLGSQIAIKLINVLVKNYALKDNLTGIEQCVHLIENLNFKPDLVFYSYFLYALAKNGHLNQIQTLINIIQLKQNLNISSLFENSYLRSDQRSFLINILRANGHQFKFELPKELHYNNCELMKNYQSFNSKPYSPLNGFEFNEQLFNQQLNNEKDIFVRMRSAYTVPKDDKIEQLIENMMIEWNRSLIKAFTNNLIAMKNQNEKDYRFNIHPFLNSFNKDKLVKFLTFYFFEISKSKYPQDLQFMASQIGYLVENQYLSMIKLRNSKNLKKIYKNYFENISDENKFCETNSRLMCNRLFHDIDLFNKEINEMVWSSQLRLDIGKNILNTCLTTLRFNVNLLKPKGKPKQVSAFFQTIQYENNKRKDSITSCHLLNRITSTMSNQTCISAKDLPMLVPPLPWNSAEGFPFLISKLFLVIEPNVIYERKIAEKIQKFNINAVLDSLNYNSLIPWKINNDVLEIQNKVFQDGGDYKLDIPHHHTKMPELTKKGLDENINDYKKRIYETKKQNREMYSLWCEMNYKLSIANYVKDKFFWSPNFIDFRGRAYPTSIYLSQVSNDVSRSLLLFGNGKKMGKNGFNWLKIHLVNLTGTKKSSTNQERIEYANQIMDEIIDSAENPLDGRGWWKNSDDPWQTLACCIEINKVLKSENPEEFVSHFPIHQDGSCNGLQHYAALGRDFDGARSVNLLPQERPADVYSEVAAIVENKRKNDASNGDECAICLDGFINRKLVKATVMTNVYGVTNYGAKLQFQKVLQENDNFPKEKLSICSNYLAKTVFSSIEDLFTCSKEIQDWLTAISIAISKRLNLPLEWVTPLGFPVVQYYYKKKTGKIQVDSNRQRNGCPPNFIHSLDATHMMLTSLYCEKEGIHFASVHDSYWTHSCDVEKLSKILREQFVNLYSDDILNHLSNYFFEIYKPYLIENSLMVDKTDLDILNLIKNVPNRGNFDINQVLNSKYFFS